MANREVTVKCTPGLAWLAVQLVIHGRKSEPRVVIDTATGVSTVTVPEHTLCTFTISALGAEGQEIAVTLKVGDVEISEPATQIQGGGPVNFYISFMI